MDWDIQHIVKLAALRIAEDELAVYRQDLETMLTMLGGLPDGSGTFEPDAENSMQLREDTVIPCEYSSDALLRNAPETHAGCVVVPKTL